MKHLPSRQLALLWKFMSGNRAMYAGAVLVTGLATLFGVIAPLVVRVTIDSIIGDKPMSQMVSWLQPVIAAVGGASVLAQNLWICAIIVIALSVAEGSFSFLRGRWSAMAAESTARKIREQVYDHLQHLSYLYHVNAETGDLVQRCTSDVDTIRQFLAMQFVEVGRALFLVSSIIPLMLSLDVRMTMMATLLVPFIFGFAIIFFVKAKRIFQVSDEAEGRMSTVLQENLSGVRVVRAFARQNFEIEKFDRSNCEFRDETYKLIRLFAWYWLVSSFLGMAQLGIVVVSGTYFAARGSLSLGTMMVFLSYIGMLLFPIRQMGRILADMGKAVVSLNRIGEILDQTREDATNHLQKPAIQGNLEFQNVYFEYESGKPILNNVSFSVKPGQTVAILGPTGSGKTSLVHLLARLYDYQGGSIKVDGVELRDIEKKWLRQHVGLVLQEPFLFSKTIKENIGLAKQQASEAEIIEAAQVAAVHDVITKFEQGYETPVGEKGVTLSGGQKQRVAIAQTLIKTCPILVLDDSLSAVDTETDAAIRTSLKQRNHATTFMISHRVNTLSEADMILVLEHGKLVQAGTHQELIRQDGLYKRIWDIQNSLEEELSHDMN